MSIYDFLFDKEDIKTLCKRLWKSRNNLALMIFPYGAWICIGVLCCVALHLLFQFLGLPIKIRLPFYRIIASLVLFMPTLTIWKHRDEFGGSDGITDNIIEICLGIWISAMFAIWL